MFLYLTVEVYQVRVYIRNQIGRIIGVHHYCAGTGEGFLCSGNRYVHFALSGLTRSAVECNEDNIIGGDVY